MSNDLRRKDTYGFGEILSAPTDKLLDKKKLADLFDTDLLDFLQ